MKLQYQKRNVGLTFIINVEKKSIESQGCLNIDKLYGQTGWIWQKISRERLINERLIQSLPTGQIDIKM